MRGQVRIPITILSLVVLGALLHLNSVAQGNRPSRIDLHRIFQPGYACRLYGRPIQFLSETELVVMSGPSEDCYRSVDQLELNIVSIDGHILTHKRWPSTDPGVVIAPGRLVLPVPGGLQVLNRELSLVESVALPREKDTPIPYIEREGIDEEGAISVEFGGREFAYGGTPLRLLGGTEAAPAGKGQLILKFADGRQLMKDGDSLVEVRKGSPPRSVVSLAWTIPPCTKFEYCQEWGAGIGFQVSTGKRKRILVFSNGSRFPITDAAGLFPYFRLQVFDLDTGAELYREAHSFRTGERSASISPDGDLLAVFDGNTVIIHKLP